MPKSAGRAILLTGGGTGGHLAIVRAVAEALRERGVRPLYVGSRSGQDRAWFEKEKGFEATLFLPTRGVVNRRGVAKIAALGATLKATLAARRFMKDHGVGAVLSVGGFSAAPASFAALTMGTPLFIHEQNAVVGRLNRLLASHAHTFFSSYGPSPTPYPVRRLFFDLARDRTRLRRVIFLGGSQGATAINDFALDVAPSLADRGVAISHQTGDRDFERVVDAYAERGIEADVFPFSPMLHEKIAAADLAVSRGGASTLWELVANRLPTLFVPYPYAAGDHQYFNAKFLADKGAGWVVRQKDLSVDIFESIAQSERIAEVGRHLVGLASPDGAERIAKALLETVVFG